MAPSPVVRIVANMAILAIILILQANPSDPSYASRILGDFERLDLAPGDEGTLRFTLRNPYDAPMEDVSLMVQIYHYVSGRVGMAVDGTLPTPSFLTSGGPSVVLAPGDVSPGALAISLDIGVPAEAPHGGIFTAGTYLIRFRLEFDLQGSHLVMVSPGFIPPATWAEATSRPTVGEQYAVMGAALGLPTIAGLLPDSAFGVKEPVPLWPFYLAGVAAAALGFLAAVAYAVERPGTLPGLEALGRRIWRRRPGDKGF